MFKRFYHPGESYFITSLTKFRVPYFVDPGCCRILIEELRIAKKLYQFDIYSFIVMPDHIHLIICPKGDKNISQIMHFIKRNTARHINDKLRNVSFSASRPVNKDDHPWLQARAQPLEKARTQLWTPEIIKHDQSLEKIKVNSDLLFQWQPSFYDRLLRTEKEFLAAVDYINIKNLQDLFTKYHLLTENELESYPFYSHTNPDLIDPF